jgi:NhaA family Na+:H+ antiporter
VPDSAHPPIVSRPATKLDLPVDLQRDHVLGSPTAPITLVEYGSYTCPRCHAAHEVIAELRDRFGDRMRYVFRHRPLDDGGAARHAAELAEYAHQSTGKFWQAHDALMKRGPTFASGEIDRIGDELDLAPRSPATESAWALAQGKVAEDAQSAAQSGARFTPTFFINDRRYEGAWDEGALAEAMLGTLGHRIHSATLNFARWGPSTGLLLLLMSVLAVALFNSPARPAFEAWWQQSFALHLGGAAFGLSVVDWINHGLLTVFFLVVALEIKREFTVGRLATPRAAALPVAAALGGMVLPAAIYFLVAPAGPQQMGWGVPIATDTAFAIAVIVMLGDRVPVELRVFLTAAVIVDDLVAIAVVALFYTSALSLPFLLASLAVTLALFVLNRAAIYRSLPYVALGLLLWVCLHEAGVHATLAGVILGIFIPTRPPGNLSALLAQAETVIQAETQRAREAILRHGPSEPALHALDVIHDRIESPASRLLRTIEPWSSYLVLPAFALANAGVVLSMDVVRGHGALMLAIILGLVVGKPVGMVVAGGLAVRLRIAVKPAAYSWRQLAGAAILGGIGFTMSIFIAAQAFPVPTDFAAAKVAIFVASLLAAAIGSLVLWPRPRGS